MLVSCPNLSDKKTSKEFNELVDAIGKKQAYHVWSYNNGNPIDKAPNGADSILFKTLLDIFNGDRKEAIKAKAKVYYNPFREWFGDWTSDDKENVSKVVDENGEPLIVWHGSRSKFDTFDGNIFFFSSNREYAFGYGSSTVYNEQKVKDRLDILNKRQSILLQRIENQPYLKYASEHPFEVVPKELEQQYETWEKTEYQRIRKINSIIASEIRFLKGYSVRDAENAFGKNYYFDRVEKEIYPVYLNIKEDITIQVGKSSIDLYEYYEEANDGINVYQNYGENFNPDTYTGTPTDENHLLLHKDIFFNINSDLIKNESGLIGKDINTNHSGNEYAVFNPNQIKSVKNNGNFSKSKNNIYENKRDISDQLYIKLKPADSKSIFGDSLGLLQSNKAASSKQIVEHMLTTKPFSDANLVLAEILSKHDIPVRFDDTLEVGQVAVTVTDDNGNSIILINQNELVGSNMFIGDTILHEIIHAVTVNAINNPQTEADKRFARLNRQTFQLFDKMLPSSQFSRSDIEGGFYSLTNEYEFAAVFITDQNARRMLYGAAIKKDKSALGKLKHFVNSIIKLFVRKDLFKSNQQKLNEYEQKFTRFLTSQQAQIKIVGDKYKFMDRLYDMTDANELALDQLHQYYKNLDNIEQGIHRDYMLRIDPAAVSTSSLTPEKNIQSTFIEIANALTKRMAAIRSSRLPEDYKQQHIQVLEAQIQSFKSNDLDAVVVIMDFIQQLMPQLASDVKAVKSVRFNEGQTMDDSVYMYQRHDNFGVYNQILQWTLQLLDDTQVEQMLLQQLGQKEQSKGLYKDILELRRTIESASSLSEEGDRIMKVILVRNVEKILKGIGEEVHSPSMGEYLGMLKQIGYDTSSWFRYLGSTDRAKDEGLRAMTYMVNKALQTADRKTHKKSVQLLRLQDKLKSGESVLDLYELDSDWRTTGYLVRDLNFGKFFNDYNRFLSELNKKYDLPENNRLAPESEDETSYRGKKVTVRQAWNMERNQWLNDHCERKFTKEYYDAYAKLSNATQERRQYISSKIAAIRQNALGDDGFYHYERLTEKEWRTLQGLYIERRLDASDYTVTGVLKTPGTIPYQIAKELQELNKTLYSDKNQILMNTEAWAKARNAVKQKQASDIREITKQIKELEDKYLVDGKFDYKSMTDDDKNNRLRLLNKLKKVKQSLRIWDKRNSKVHLKINEDTNKALLFEAIDKEAGITSDQVVYPYKGDGGALYKQNEEKIKKLLAPYREHSDMGKVNLEHLPIAVRSEIEKLEEKNAEIKENAKFEDSAITDAAKLRGEAFSKYAQVVPTEQFEQFRAQWYKNNPSTIEDDFDFFDEEFDQMTGTLVGVDDSGAGIYKLYRMYTTVIPNDDYYDEFVEVTAGDGWIENDNNNVNINPVFAAARAKYGNMSMIPKRELYNNSAAYDKIRNSESLRNLYDAVYETIKESNDEFGATHQYRDDYLLPQITGTLYKRLKGTGNKWRAVKDYIIEGTGFGGNLGFEQEAEYGLALDKIFDRIDEFGQIIEGENEIFGGKTSGIRPDGRKLNMLPQYFSRKLKDPGQISADLVGITCEYYNQCERYKNKAEIKDACESIVDMFEDRQYMTKGLTGGKTIKSGNQSNTWQIGQKFLDMHLYNIRNVNEYFGINFGKIAKLFRAMTVAINLGCNIAVAATGFLTAGYSHLINAITGQRYDFEDFSRAGVEVFEHILRNGGGIGYIGNKLSEDKLMVLAEYFNISDQGKRKYKNTNWNRLANAMNDNWCFGMLTGLDFIIKSNIMVSTLMSYKLLDGHFTTEEDIKLINRHASQEQLDDILDRWKNSKSIYEILSVKDGMLEVDPEYKYQFEEVEHAVHSRILKYSEAADGMATETQKAAITTNILGAATLTHRQYFPLLLQERFGHTVYDYDTQEYTGGIFRTGVNAAKLSLFSLFDLFRAESLEQGKQKAKERWAEYFDNDATLNDTYLGQIRKYQLRQIIAENLAFFTLIFIPVSMLCAYADDDDKKDLLLLQLLAYIGRRAQWETYTPYRPIEMYNNIKSVTAQTSTSDKLSDVVNSLLSYTMPNGSLFDTFLSNNLKNKNNYLVKRGVYKGWAKLERDAFKLLPQHNLYEQIFGSKSKRKYYENQIMKLD